jgi:hypothetical protein
MTTSMIGMLANMKEGDFVCAFETGWHKRRKWWVYYAWIYPPMRRNILGSLTWTILSHRLDLRFTAGDIVDGEPILLVVLENDKINKIVR